MTEPNTPNENDHIDSARLQDAQAWLRRLTSGDATRFEAQAFERWCQKNPANRAAFAEAKKQWKLLTPAITAMLKDNPEMHAEHRKSLVKSGNTRRQFFKVAAGAVASAGVAAYAPFGFWPSLGQWNADYRTAAGEQNQMLVDNQIQLVLNTRTSIRKMTANGQVTGVALLSGEASIDMAGARQGFYVQAANGRAASTSGQFQVRHTDDSVCVTCMQGNVQVDHPAGARVLSAMQQVVYDTQSVGSIQTLTPDELPSWRHGDLVFRKTPLATVVDEINRYRPGRIILATTVDSTVSARFKITELDTALLQIQSTFNLTARALPGEILILS